MTYKSTIMAEWEPLDYDYYVRQFTSKCRYVVLIEDYDQNYARKYFKTLQSAKEFIMIQTLAGLSDHISLVDFEALRYADWYFVKELTYPFKGELRESVFP
jgi:hypothetical protein